MAFARKNKSVVETNHVSAVRTGNIKAQHKAHTDLENGMAVTVDDIDKVVKKAGSTVEVGDLYLHVSEEQLYESHLGRNAFYIKAGQYPRCLKLTEGDIFETNALATGEDVVYAVEDKLTVIGGLWTKSTLGSEAKVAEIVELVTLPNGEPGAKIKIIKTIPAVS
jgi:hypothetical protein